MGEFETVEMVVLGQRIRVKAQVEQLDLLKNTLEFVNQRLKEAEGIAKSSHSLQLALVALFHLSEEYLQAKERTIQFKKEVELASSELKQRLADAP